MTKFYNIYVQVRVIGNELGFSLIDLIVASMMSIIIISICYSLIAFQFNQLRKVRALYVQNILLAQIKSATTSTNLRESGNDPINAPLRNCLAGVDGGICKSTEQYELRLLDGKFADGAPPVSGFRTDPVGFDFDAQRCALGAGNSNCIFTVKTYFRVQCPESLANPYVIPPTCPGVQPAIVQVFFEFDTIADFSANRVLGIKPVVGSIIVKM